MRIIKIFYLLSSISDNANLKWGVKILVTTFVLTTGIFNADSLEKFGESLEKTLNEVTSVGNTATIVKKLIGGDF